MRGRFIVLEGMDGSGKSTMTDYVTSKLQEAGIYAVRTFEIGGTPIGKMIRTTFLNAATEKIHPGARMLAFLAARAQHIENVIKPALESGTWIVCDRYELSTLVYQGINDGLLDSYLDIRNNANLCKSLGLNFTPDYLIYLDVSAEVAHQRMTARASSDNTTYKSDINQAYKTKSAYDQAISLLPPDTAVLTVNADMSLDDCKQHVDSLLACMLSNS
jgi:dTMP kinase